MTRMLATLPDVRAESWGPDWPNLTGDRTLVAEAHAWLANRRLVIPTPVGFVMRNHAELPFGAADGQDQQMATTGNYRHA